MKIISTLDIARDLDRKDPLRMFKKKFLFPQTKNNKDTLYFAGHSLGLMPVQTKGYIDEELDAWGNHALNGHYKKKYPWISYHRTITHSLADIVGAEDDEVVAMNSLTVNLHLMFTSFYRPTRKRYKILIEDRIFSSDKYAIESQIRLHGLDPAIALVKLKPQKDTMIIGTQNLITQIEELGDSLSLIFLGNCNYLTGEYFDIPKVTQAGKGIGASVGFNLAHGVGNIPLNLHGDDVDFAVWCSYKYLNGGPGCLAGTFIHRRHLKQKNHPRLEGWWGSDERTRFQMKPHFQATESAEAWQLSNPPILELASLRSSLQIFETATLRALFEKSRKMTDHLISMIHASCSDSIDIQTPTVNRGSMLSIKIKKNSQNLMNAFEREEVIVDFREPDILRITPAPLYTSYEDIFHLVEFMRSMTDE